MIGSAACDDHSSVVVADDAADVAEQLRFDLGRDDLDTILGREDDVNEYLDQ